MKINIIFPYNNIGGAFRSTYELSNNLILNGHDVIIYVPFFPYLEGHSLFSYEGFKIFYRGIGRSILRRNNVKWFELRATFKIVPLISDFFIRDADVVVANHWPTVSDVLRLGSSKGIKFNFIRDTNPWMYKPELETEAFKMELLRIVVSPWIEDYLTGELGLEVEGIVQNGTNFKDFNYPRKGYKNPPTIGMVYYDHPQKGMEDGFKVLKNIKERYPDIEVQIFGLSEPKHIPFDAKFYLNPKKDKLKELYGTSDIFLFPSVQEGSGNPPREAMVSGCALVATNVGCIPECTLPGKTALVVEPGDQQGMILNIVDLIENPSKLQLIGKSAQAYITEFTWERSARKLENIFKNKIEGREVNE